MKLPVLMMASIDCCGNLVGGSLQQHAQRLGKMQILHCPTCTAQMFACCFSGTARAAWALPHMYMQHGTYKIFHVPA